MWFVFTYYVERNKITLRKTIMDFIRHLFGLCGEAHPNIFHLFIYAPVISIIVYKIKSILK